MKIDAGQTISVLANLGVIAGIFFLVLELRQNNELMAADARFNQVVLIQQAWTTIAEDPGIVAILVKDRNGGALTEEEEFRLNAFWMRALLRLQWQYRELPDSTEWIAGQRRNYLSYGSLRRTWEGNSGGSRSAGKDNFEPAFVEFFEQNVVER